MSLAVKVSYNNEGCYSRFAPRHISEPKELESMRGKGIVDIHAGGWSFHALDRHGRVWMWGTVSEQQSNF